MEQITQRLKSGSSDSLFTPTRSIIDTTFLMKTEPMTEYSASFTIDLEAGAIYLWLRQGEVEKSLEGTAKTIIDVDEHGRIVGLEIILNEPKLLEAFKKNFQSKQL